MAGDAGRTPDDRGPLSRVTTYVYDATGCPIGPVAPGPNTPYALDGPATWTVYDALGRVTAGGTGPYPYPPSGPPEPPGEEPDEPHVVG